ncbi:unnamed protein product [Discula destructiva]
MSSAASRKRSAPGASPVVPAGPQSHAYATSDQMQRWNDVAAMSNGYSDASDLFALPQQQQQQTTQQQQNQQPALNGYEAQAPYELAPQPQQRLAMHHQPQAHNQPHPQVSIPGSNVVARRNDNTSRALVPSRSGYDYQGNVTQWPSSENALVPAQNAVDPEQQQLMEALAKAEKIAEDAQSDRPGASKRSIPPFVQKLATFLNLGTDQQLIRWSDKGDSFIVLDEDEFARSLIPQLFKHANYASFVRQLNMYGFHKRVGLADNSMRSSEKKNKAPSEYAHPYFRRGYDVLQWLIQKPNKKKLDAEKRKTAGGKREEVYDIDSDDEYENAQPYAAPGTVAKTEITKLREQFAEIQSTQQQALNLIQTLRNSQNDIMQKAHKVELQYQRHDHSIQTIIHFLTNVFRKSLEGKSAEHMAEMLSSIMPMQGQGAKIPTGSVQDMSDMAGQANFDQQQNVAERARSPAPRHRQHLLPGIPADDTEPGVRYAEAAAQSSGYQAPYVTQGSPQQASRVTELDNSPEDTTSPNEYYHNEHEPTPEDAIMQLMDATTDASVNSGMDLTEAAVNPSASMTLEQRRRLMHSLPQRASSSQQSTQQKTQKKKKTQQNCQQSNQQSNQQSTSLADMRPAGIVESNVQQGSQSNISTQASTPVANSIVQSPLYNDNTMAPPLNLAFSPVPQAGLMDDANNALHQLNQIDNIQHTVGEGIQNLARTSALLPPNGHITSMDGAGDSNVPDSDYFGNAMNALAAASTDGSFNPSDWLHDDPSLFGNADPVNFDFSLEDMGNLEGGPGFMPTWPGHEGGNEPTASSHRANDHAAAPQLEADGTGVKTSDTPSPAVTEEIERADMDQLEMPAAKRQRGL